MPPDCMMRKYSVSVRLNYCVNQRELRRSQGLRLYPRLSLRLILASTPLTGKHRIGRARLVAKRDRSPPVLVIGSGRAAASIFRFVW